MWQFIKYFSQKAVVFIETRRTYLPNPMDVLQTTSLACNRSSCIESQGFPLCFLKFKTSISDLIIFVTIDLVNYFSSYSTNGSQKKKPSVLPIECITNTLLHFIVSWFWLPKNKKNRKIEKKECNYVCGACKRLSNLVWF